jgi:predicted nucleotidyltransferase
MSAQTDACIQRLSAEALNAKTEDDVDRILEELRVALQEHVSLAKEKLREQVNSFA